MKYMLLIYVDEETFAATPPDQVQEIIAETDALNASLWASGEMVGAYGVADQVLAKQVASVDGVPAVTDGPYIETKEYLGSFTIVEVDGLERALEIAAANPASRFTKVEVRPITHEAPRP